MTQIVIAVLIALLSDIGYAAQPSQNLVTSCLLARSSRHSVTIRSLNAHEVEEEDGYADGFNASYMFKYRGSDVGYAESKEDHALIYMGKLYRLSKAIPLGENHGVKPGAFDPTLAQWSIAKEGAQQYFCVSFNFDGLGRSGSFQNVHGGYLMNTRTKDIYFVVRDVR
jgi:hypothetical protein